MGDELKVKNNANANVVNMPANNSRQVETKTVFKSVFDLEPPTEKARTVVLIDDFTNKTMITDPTHSHGITHGDIGLNLLKKNLPINYKIESFNATILSEEKDSVNEINKALDEVVNNMNKGKKYAALDMPDAYYLSFKVLSEQFGEEITPQNIAQKKDKIKDWAINAYPDGLGPLLKKLDQISSNGVPIYLPAGNEGKDSFNMFSLANAKIVGAIDEKGNKTNYSGDNSLVSIWKPGRFVVREKCETNDKCEYNYNIQGSDKIPSGQTNWYFDGTSYSVPVAVGEDLTRKK